MKNRTSIITGTFYSLALLASINACTGEVGPGEDIDGGGGAVEGSSGGADGVGGTDTTTGGADATSGGADSGGADTTTGGADATSGGADGSGGETVEVIDPTFETVKFVIKYQTPTCGGSDCHGGNEHNPLNLVLDDGLYERLMDPAHFSEVCDDMQLITPGDPAQSAFVKILTDGCIRTTEKDGEMVETLVRMPAACTVDEFGSNCVPEEYLVAIAQWVTDGALEN